MVNKTATVSKLENIDDFLPGKSLQKELIFEILDLSKLDNTNTLLSFEYSRKTFYTATFLQGDYIVEFEDDNIELSGSSLLFTSSKVPFGIKARGGIFSGVSCVFKEDFITKNNSGYRLLEFPIYKPGRQNIYSLTDNQAENFTEIYAKIFDEKLENGTYKESLQRNYPLELIFQAQKLDPESNRANPGIHLNSR